MKYRTGIEQVSTSVDKWPYFRMILKKLRQMYTKIVKMSTPSKALRHPFDTQVSKLLFIYTNTYRSFLQSSKANLFFLQKRSKKNKLSYRCRRFRKMYA